MNRIVTTKYVFKPQQLFIETEEKEEDEILSYLQVI